MEVSGSPAGAGSAVNTSLGVPPQGPWHGSKDARPLSSCYLLQTYVDNRVLHPVREGLSCRPLTSVCVNL